MYITDINRKRKLKRILFTSFILFLLLIVRVGWIQLVQGSELQEMAKKQQALNRKISPKRGTIYDATGKNILAVSATAEQISINPNNIKKEQKEMVAKKLAEIFELDYEKTLKKVSRNSSIESIVQKVEKEKTDVLRLWMLENNISSGINIDEDMKRYYPSNNLASHIIGFCGSDTQGLEGIEAKYDEILKGSQGKILKQTDALGKSLENKSEEYVAAIDGSDLILTIDANIQSIVEKYLENACIDNACTDGGSIIIMNPQNGDILAMATYPNYNLNTPFEIYKENNKIWRNKSINDTYEPGSTFKLFTTAMALEEGITTTDKAGEFSCTGYIEIAGVKIKCWRHYRPHGLESLRDGLMNSCNPVFIGLGQKIGVAKYYEYLKKFGLLDKTDIDLFGEANSIFLQEKKVGPVELATISFGQRFKITPIQLITGVSSIVNGGNLIQPRVVKAIVNPLTGEKSEIEPIIKNRVISEKTAKEVASMMESVVAEGTGKNAQVKGYTIGGKTGTSEDGVNTNKYVTSFIGMTPTENSELAILITLYNPTGEGGHQGGTIAAPIASQILGEVLPYLDVPKYI